MGEPWTSTTTRPAGRPADDELGNLRAVDLADGIRIEYLLDGKKRRIGKKVNGVLVQGFLYKDQLEPVAELNGSGQVVAVFTYGSRPHVPDYLVKAGRTYRIVSDHLGSPRLVIDTGTGEVVQQMGYDEFGRDTTRSLCTLGSRTPCPHS